MLVNNAANDQRHKFEDVTVEYWDERMATNLRHQFFAIQAVAPMMRAAGGGSIINFGSISWHTSQGGMPAYTTAKAGVEGLTKGMARDLGADGIRVNCVIPGWIMTQRQIDLWLTPEAEANLLQAQCLKTKLVPADVARMVLMAGLGRQSDVHQPVVGGRRRPDCRLLIRPDAPYHLRRFVAETFHAWQAEGHGPRTKRRLAAILAADIDGHRF